MNANSTAIMPGVDNYDHCLITSCLKKLFVRTAKSTDEPVLVVHNNISAVRKDMDRINKKDVVEMSYDYLEAMEQTIDGAAFRYAVIYKGNVPVLFAYFQLFTLTSGNFSLEKNKGFVKGIFRFFLRLKNIKVLISGNALRNETLCYCFNEAVLSSEAAAEIIAAAAEKIADEENAGAVILKDIPGSAKTKKWLERIGYHMPWEDKVMTLNIDSKWDSLSSYIDVLSRKYRTRAKKILADGHKISVKKLSKNELADYREDINRLFKNVADNQSFVLVSPSYDHFVKLKKVYKSNLEVFGFFLGQELVAFSSAFITGGAYELYYVGFDYGYNGEYQLYFNILFSGLARGIQLGKRQLKLGRTSFDAKASIGARPHEIDYLIKMVSIPNIVSKWFVNYFASMEDAKWKLRNPLKQFAEA
jgi:hypothetical protein